VSELYHEGHRALQDRFDTRRLANRLDGIVHDAFTESERAFIERMPMFFLATVDARGHANCSYKGGAPGFVRVLDERTIVFPSYDGNGMFLSMGNLAQTGEVGMLFIDFDQQRRMRVNGHATVDPADPLLAEFHEAQLIVRVAVREVFGNCPRYIHRMQMVEPSRFAPRTDCETPVPAWKHRIGDELLPANDPARDREREVLER